MLSKSQIKAITSLQSKKFRQKYAQFIVEGEKSILELKESSIYTIESIISEDEMPEKISGHFKNIKLITNAGKDFKKITTQSTPTGILAVVNMPKTTVKPESGENKIQLFLDNIQDPGNLGTIIRTADWFGVYNIYANDGCADLYNSKTIQATMGSFARINFIPSNPATLNELKLSGHTLIGATLEGTELSGYNFPKKTVLVMGNEGKGISHEIMELLDMKITIKKYGQAESLNVASATAIICYEYAKQTK